MQFSLDLSLDVAEQEVAGGNQRGDHLLATRSPEPADLQQGQPADALILTLALTSEKSPLPRVEDLAIRGWCRSSPSLPGVGLVSISGGQRPGGADSRQPDGLAAYGLTLEELRAPSRRQTSIRRRRLPTARGRRTHRRERSTPSSKGTSTHYRLPQRCPRASVRRRRCGRRCRERETGGLDERGAGVIVNIQRQPGPTSSTWLTTSNGCCRSS